MTATQYPIITVCGSMRYFDRMLIAANEYSRAGWIVLMPLVPFTPSEQIDNPQKEMLDDMHYTKISMSEAILVIGSHRGESTTNEIKYAIAHQIKVIEYVA